MTLGDLLQAGTQLGLSCRPVRAEIASLRTLRLPVVLHWVFNHFVVLIKADGNSLTILDPAMGRRSLSYQEFGRFYTGVAVEFSKIKASSSLGKKVRLPLTTLFRSIDGLKSNAAVAVTLSLAVQGALLVQPLFLQLVLDKGVNAGNRGFVLLCGGLFFIMGIFFGWARLLRSASSAFLIFQIDYQNTASLQRHLLKLPLSFFERRLTGSILERVRIFRQIREILAAGTVEGLIDGILALMLSAFLLFYQPLIFIISAIFCGLYLIVKLRHLPTYKDLVATRLVFSGLEAGQGIENVRNITAIKAFGLESRRESMWQNAYARCVNTDIKIDRLRRGEQFADDVLFSAGRIATICLSALLVISGRLTIGQLVAVTFYQAFLFLRTRECIDRLFDVQKAAEHLDKSADILLEQAEDEDGLSQGSLKDRIGVELSGKIDLADITYQIPGERRILFQDVSLTIEPGEILAITGPSGCGKTTLLKLLCGLLRPSGGEIRFDGYPISAIGYSALRGQIGIVLQDDDLFEGSLFQNISMFDPCADEGRVIEVCQLAGIHQTIIAMPMAYDTRVGLGAGALSGGERQRIFLARALYKSPRILLLDESSSDLDLTTEREINSRLKELSMTRIIVAHRPDTIQLAHRVFDFGTRILGAQEAKRAQA
jgi:ATP-binding cassette subfamily B protein RaxB